MNTDGLPELVKFKPVFIKLFFIVPIKLLYEWQALFFFPFSQVKL
jgi:hypothetical protein